MDERYEYTQEDLPPQPGLFSLYELYAIQTRLFRVQHGARLREHLTAQRTSLQCLDWAISGVTSNDETDAAVYERWLETEGHAMNMTDIEDGRYRVRDEILTTLAHIALAQMRPNDDLAAASPPYSLW